MKSKEVEKKTKRIEVRITESQEKELIKRAARLKILVSDYIRKILFERGEL